VAGVGQIDLSEGATVEWQVRLDVPTWESEQRPTLIREDRAAQATPGLCTGAKPPTLPQRHAHHRGDPSRTSTERVSDRAVHGAIEELRSVLPLLESLRVPVLHKPFEITELRSMLEAVMGEAAPNA
jgi:hypothetical protein